MSPRSPRRQLGRTGRLDAPDPPSQLGIERAVVLIDMNICDGSSASDDETATIATGGMIGDVARLFDAMQAAMHALRSYQFGNAAPALAKSVADTCKQVIADAARENE